MIDTLTKELGKGYIHPGRGLYQLNLLCVPKKDSETGLLTKIRVARHASFAGSDGGVALNDAIPKEETKMDGEEALPSFIMYIVLFLRCWYISLRDLKDAFRQLLLDEADVGTIQYSLFGLTFVDLRQVYGVASAANRCQQFSQTLRWIMAHNATKWTKENAVVILSLILAYIDDYTIGGRDRPECRALTDCFEALIAQKIDVGISLLKSLDCIQVGVTNGIGFRLNAEPKTVFVPILKAFDITMGILGVLLCHWIFGDAWECLIGRILFWAKFDPRAKVWCNYALKDIQLHLRSLSTSQKERTVMHVEFRTRKALSLYLHILPQVREVPIISILEAPSISLTATSDASDLGGGFMCADWFCSYTFNTAENASGLVHQDMDISLREAHAVLMLLWRLRHQLSGHVLHLLVDNSSVEWGMRKCWARSTNLIGWIEEITALSFFIHCDVKVSYIPTWLNLPSDMLSRGIDGRLEFDRMAKAFEWSELEEIRVDSFEPSQYYEDLRIMNGPVKIPEWIDFAPKRKSKYVNPELFKLWPQNAEPIV